MEQLSAIFQISILLIVAFLIGFGTAWLYWRSKYRKMKAAYEKELSDRKDLTNKQRHTIDKLNEEIRKHEKEILALKNKSRQMVKTKEKDYIPVELYDLIIKDVGEGISVSDEDGYFIVFNPRLEEITGYTKEEANKHNEKLFLDTLYPDVELREKVADHIDHVPENDDHTNIKTVITTKDKKEIPVLVSSTMVTYNNKKYFLTAYRDVSVQPEVEA